MTTVFIIKFGSDQMKIVGAVAFWIFCPIGSRVNENEKNNCKNLKIENFEKIKTIVGR